MRSRATLVAFACAAACALLGVLSATWRVPEPWLDGPYRDTIYPAMQTAGTTVTNLVPVAGADIVLVALLASIGFGLARVRNARQPRLALLRTALSTAAAAGLLTTGFYAFWGFWYARPSIVTRVDYDPKRVSPEALAALARRTEREINAAAPLAHADALDGADLRAAIVPTFQEAIAALGAPRPIVVSRTKRGLFDPYMTATGITGFMDPFGWDVVIQHRLSRYERPFTIAHEWTHLAGFASETEANYSAVLACIRASDPVVRYSGWINVYYVLPDEARKTMHLSPLVIADLNTIYFRFQHDIVKPISLFQWKSYDRYLKANHVAAGVVSYGQVLSLVLGVRTGPNGLPLPRTH